MSPPPPARHYLCTLLARPIGSILRQRVAKVTTLETGTLPDNQRLAEAVAHNYFKPLACKSEHDVALPDRPYPDGRSQI